MRRYRRPTQAAIELARIRERQDAAAWAGGRDFRLPPAEAYAVAPVFLLVMLAPR